MSQELLFPKGHVYLIGAGIVGRAILRAHVQARVSTWIIDRSAEIVHAAIDELEIDDQWQIGPPKQWSDDCWGIHLQHGDDQQPKSRSMVIESIVEKLDVKREFYSQAESRFGHDAVLCSNTSNLRISAIAESLDDASRFAGMHFFMPVDQRPATEIVRGKETSPSTINACCEHAQRIQKTPLVVADGPGFIVNRMLSPYLNEALLLLCRGTTAAQIERAAHAYGMPMSPLELADYIGLRTMFDAGRVFWQAFPDRLSPSPMLAGMIKRKRFGRAVGAGLYDYPDGKRSIELSAETTEIATKYARHEQEFEDSDVVDLLSIPMWIEAALAWRDGVTDQATDFDLAMRGGLGYDRNRSWIDFYDALGSDRMLAAITRWSPMTAAMNSPQELQEALRTQTPSQTLQHFS
ncbi:MAG: 3-hydroxyacyl-CoA dehydrogenase family protein [Planctomycetota bacterium]